jgi:hypothetical protein
MNTKKRRILVVVLLMVALGNYSRIKGTENIRTVEFLSIFAIGAMSALLLRDLFSNGKPE